MTHFGPAHDQVCKNRFGINTVVRLALRSADVSVSYFNMRQAVGLITNQILNSQLRLLKVHAEHIPMSVKSKSGFMDSMRLEAIENFFRSMRRDRLQIRWPK